MGEYFKYAACVTDDQPLYLFDKTFAWKFPALAAEYTVPDYFKQDLFSVLGPDARPDHKWIIVGPKHSGSVFHKVSAPRHRHAYVRTHACTPPTRAACAVDIVHRRPRRLRRTPTRRAPGTPSSAAPRSGSSSRL